MSSRQVSGSCWRLSVRAAHWLLFVGLSLVTQSAHAQSRATLCEEEPDPEQAFTDLQIAVDAGDRAGASACADRYLELAPRGPHVREANSLVASMRQRTEASDVLRPPASTPALSSPDLTGWAIVGVGGALLVAGGILLGVSASDAAAVESYRGQWRDVADRYYRIPTLSGVGWSALALGAAGVVIGAIVQVQNGQSSQVAVRVSPWGVLLTGSF